MMGILSVSIMPVDFGRLDEEIKTIERAGVDGIHADIMDGCFVPNITFGPDILRAVKKATSLPIHAHLMIHEPDRMLKEFADAGADWLCVHAESNIHLSRTIQHIRELDRKAAIVLNPATPLESIEYLLHDVDMVIIMTVNPGFSGQKLISSVIPKISRLREKIDSLKLPVLIGVDGGVHRDTIGELATAGADVFVSGSEIFSDNNLEGNVKHLKEQIAALTRKKK
jgi:ribulose-phosphate 3-epimerase